MRGVATAFYQNGAWGASPYRRSHAAAPPGRGSLTQAFDRKECACKPSTEMCRAELSLGCARMARRSPTPLQLTIAWSFSSSRTGLGW